MEKALDKPGMPWLSVKAEPSPQWWDPAAQLGSFALNNPSLSRAIDGFKTAGGEHAWGAKSSNDPRNDTSLLDTAKPGL